MASAGPPGPSPEQMEQMRQAMAAEAARRGLTVEQFQQQQRAMIEKEAADRGLSPQEYVQQLRQQAMADMQRQQMAAQQQAQAQEGEAQSEPNSPQQQQPPPGQQRIPINNTGTPDPRALALAQWLRGQQLKTRTCILGGQRKDMFRVKRALRAIQSPAYEKASNKANSQLPQLTPEFPAEEIFKLLPLSLLALRVSQVDPDAPKSKKRVKGQWTVKVEQQQDISSDLHYVFLYEAPNWKTKFYAAGALVLVFAVILFPLWPLKLRVGVWYLSMGMLGLIAAFFAMAIVRLILFCLTVFTIPPGFWLYPNLFEDVGFFDSFRPLWGWHETAEDKKKARKAKREARKAKAAAKAAKNPKPAQVQDHHDHSNCGHDHSHDHNHDHHDHDHTLHDHTHHDHGHVHAGDDNDYEDVDSDEESEAEVPTNITVADASGASVNISTGLTKRDLRATVDDEDEDFVE